MLVAAPRAAYSTDYRVKQLTTLYNSHCVVTVNTNPPSSVLWLHEATSSRKDKSKDVDVYRSKSLYKFLELNKGVSSENNRTFWFKNFGDKCTIKTGLVAMTISKEGGSAEHHSILHVQGTVLDTAHAFCWNPTKSHSVYIPLFISYTWKQRLRELETYWVPWSSSNRD